MACDDPHHCITWADEGLAMRVVAVDGDSVTLSDGARVRAGTVLATTGQRPRVVPGLERADRDALGRLRTTPDLAVVGLGAVWAAGDVARFERLPALLSRPRPSATRNLEQRVAADRARLAAPGAPVAAADIEAACARLARMLPALCTPETGFRFALSARLS